jgi:hypothetical protein
VKLKCGLRCQWPQVRAEYAALVTKPEGFRPPIFRRSAGTSGTSSRYRVDGEVVALDQAGKPAFNLLQGFGDEAPEIVLYTFDLLMLGGKDVRLWPLVILTDVLAPAAQTRRRPERGSLAVRGAVPAPELFVNAEGAAMRTRIQHRRSTRPPSSAP